MWYIILCFFWMLNHPYDTGINPIWSQCMTFFLLFYSLSKYLVEDFYIYIQKRYWSIIFYVLNSLSGFGIRVIVTLCACVHAKSLQSCPTLCNPWTVAHQATLSMGFSRQEYWSGLACPPPGDLPDPGINQCLLWIQHCRWILTIEPPGQPDRDLEEWILGVFPSLAFFFFWYSLRNLFFMYLVSLSLWDISSTLSVHFFLK